MKSMKIAVVVPTITGREEQFERCLKSIERAEKYYYWNDATFEVISEKDSTREEIIRKTDFKPFKFVLFIDDDDYITPDSFTELHTLKSKIGVMDRYGIYPKGGLKYERASVLYGKNSLFDPKLITKRVSTPIWYITGIFFDSKIIENFKKKILSKYDIKGCWEDLMYWAFITREYPDLRAEYMHNGTYIQVCAGDSLTRNNKQKFEQMDYNMNLVKKYLLSTGMSEYEIDICFEKINRCRVNKSGAYGYKYTQEGYIRENEGFIEAASYWLLPSEIEKLKFEKIYPEESYVLLGEAEYDLPEKFIKALNSSPKDIVRISFLDEDRYQFEAYDLFSNGSLELSGVVCALEQSLTTKLKWVKLKLRDNTLIYINRYDLVRQLDFKRSELEEEFSKPYVDWCYSKHFSEASKRVDGEYYFWETVKLI